MNYSKIKPIDIANGSGCRTTIWICGCNRHCPGCFNEELQDFNYGQLFTHDTIKTLIEYLERPYIKGLTVLGGEPLEPDNQQDIAKLIIEVRSRLPSKTIWVYTGYTWEELLDNTSLVQTPYLFDILQNINILVDGPFILDKKESGLVFRGSSNQRFIETSLSLKYNKLILSEFNSV